MYIKVINCNCEYNCVFLNFNTQIQPMRWDIYYCIHTYNKFIKMYIISINYENN